ncbi:31207_t:CDS:2, partial [Racocetra persica]
MSNNALIEKTEDSSMSTLVVDKDDWKWPCFDEWYDEHYDKMERRVKVESINIIPFVVIYPRNGKPYVEVSSPKLMKILRDILPNKNTFDEVDDDNPKSIVNLKRLVRFLEQEFKQTIKAREVMIAHKKVSYDMLWVFYTEKLE